MALRRSRVRISLGPQKVKTGAVSHPAENQEKAEILIMCNGAQLTELACCPEWAS